MQGWKCTLDVVSAFLGFIPQQGVVYDVPKYRVEQFSRIDRAKAVLCATKLRISYRIVH